MITEFPTLDDAIGTDAHVTGMDIAVVRTSARLGLLDSALQAPLAGFGDVDLYPEDWQRLGVLCSRIVLNHPFLDGNRRTGFLLMWAIAQLNGVTLEFADQHEVAAQIEALAARELDEDAFCEWLRPFTVDVTVDVANPTASNCGRT